MTSGIDEILQETDDRSLCDRTCSWIVERHGEQLDLSNVPEQERVVLCVLHASGIIDNGGFNYLFETSFGGDPHYFLTAGAFKAIGAQECFAAFERVFKLFRERKPPADMNARLKEYRQGGATPRHEIDRLFWKGSKKIDQLLAAYVRAHREAYLNAAPASRMKKSAASTKPPSLRKRTSGQRDEMTPPDRIEALPHWARVALAARCARLALPEFRRAWPDALPERLQTVVRCLAAAEHSAQQGRVVGADRKLTTNAMTVVGAATMGLYGSPFENDKERYPADGNLAIIASKAARVALMAAETALNGPDKSANYAAEAVSDAIDLADAVGKNKIPRRIGQALADLERESARRAWDDESPVSPTVFTKPSKQRRPWWRFW